MEALKALSASKKVGSVEISTRDAGVEMETKTTTVATRTAMALATYVAFRHCHIRSASRRRTFECIRVSRVSIGIEFYAVEGDAANPGILARWRGETLGRLGRPLLHQARRDLIADRATDYFICDHVWIQFVCTLRNKIPQGTNPREAAFIGRRSGGEGKAGLTAHSSGCRHCLSPGCDSQRTRQGQHSSYLFI